VSAGLACLALAASLPVAAIGWLAGAALDRAETSPAPRYRLWEAAFWSVPAAAAAILASPWLPVGGLRAVLHATAAGVRGLPTADASVHTQGPSLALIALEIGLAGAAWRLGGLGLRLRRLRDVERRATARLGRLAGLPVRLSEDLDSPMIVGLWRPTILLPVRLAEPQAAQAAALVCRHEAAHAARGDNLRVLLEEAAMAVLWFNAMLAAVRGRLSDAREEVCDAVAVAGLEAHDRRLYARSLLDCLTARPSNLPATGLIGLNRRSTTMRIEAILTPRPHRRRTALVGGLLAALAVSATAAVALAAAQTPADGKPAARWGPIDITADRIQTDNTHHTSLWIGNASLSGVTKETMSGLFIDGRAATEADLPSLPQRRFASIKATFNANGHELDRVDAKTKPD